MIKREFIYYAREEKNSDYFNFRVLYSKFLKKKALYETIFLVLFSHILKFNLEQSKNFQQVEGFQGEVFSLFFFL